MPVTNETIFFPQKGFDMHSDVEKCKEVMPGIETYRGHYLDLKKLRLNWISEENPTENEVSIKYLICKHIPILVLF